jgi:hypothetical protein
MPTTGGNPPAAVTAPMRGMPVSKVPKAESGAGPGRGHGRADDAVTSGPAHGRLLRARGGAADDCGEPHRVFRRATSR